MIQTAVSRFPSEAVYSRPEITVTFSKRIMLSSRLPWLMLSIFTGIILAFSINMFAYADTASSYTDSNGKTHYRDSKGKRGTSYTDSHGKTHYSFNDGTRATAYTDSYGKTHYRDNKGKRASSYTDSKGKKHYSAH